MADRCKMESWALPLGTGLHTLALGLMAGGMLALGAFTAPVVFGHFGRLEAGPVMAVIFRRFDMLLLGLLGLIWLGELLRLLSKAIPTRTPLAIVRYVLLVILSGSLLYSTLVLNADIERMNRAGLHREWTTEAGRRFESTHKLSENIYKLDMLLAALLIVLTPFMARRREAGV